MASVEREIIGRSNFASVVKGLGTNIQPQVHAHLTERYQNKYRRHPGSLAELVLDQCRVATTYSMRLMADQLKPLGFAERKMSAKLFQYRLVFPEARRGEVVKHHLGTVELLASNGLFRSTSLVVVGLDYAAAQLPIPDFDTPLFTLTCYADPTDTTSARTAFIEQVENVYGGIVDGVDDI